MKNLTKKIIFTSVIALFLAVMVVGNVLCGTFNNLITQYLCGFGLDYENEEFVAQKKKSAEQAIAIEEEGIVLLKNENNILPLKGKTEGVNPRVNIFGWGGTNEGFIYCGSGSGEGGQVDVPFLSALNEAGIDYNQELAKAYSDLGYKRLGDWKSGPSTFFRLYEADEDFYTKSMMLKALKYSDIAIIVISRMGGEGKDLPLCQYDSKGRVIDNGRTYLELSEDEELMIEQVTSYFDKVIVLLNAANAMETGFVDSDKITACVNVGFPGKQAAKAIGNVLLGKVTPSGHLVDTYAYDVTTAASYANFATNGVRVYANASSYSSDQNNLKYVDYAEDIYIGYKWYETADAEGFWSSSYAKDKWNVTKYEEVVQYPFGYGLSYADFIWNVNSISFSNGSTFQEKDAKVTIEVEVLNDSETYSGADVVQVYFQAPYTKGGIEKSSIALCAFAKTPVLKPNQAADLTLEFALSDLASYDCYDKNNNGFMGYELEEGEYTVSLRTDVHTKKDVTLGKNEYTFKIPAGGFKYETDPVTGETVENRFTNYTNTTSGASSTIDANPVMDKQYSIDGSDSEQNIKYMTRSDFAGTFPAYVAPRNLPKYVYDDVIVVNKNYKTNSDDVMPVTGSTETSYTIKDMLGLSYNDPKWDALISQLSLSELMLLCACGGYQTVEVNSIGKPYCVDLDGPTGLTTSNTSAEVTKATNFPSQNMVAQSFNIYLAYNFGAAVGEEAFYLKVDGWYAPGANMHRSPFGGRNCEYYSECSFLTGIMAAYEVKGCIDQGMYAYLKHFAVNDSDTERNGQNRYLTEQALREIYLKPFELAVKIGGCNAMMSSVDRIGNTRSSSNYQLLTEVLRGEWGFEGSVISDYYQDFNGNRSTHTHSVDEMIRAGNDLALEPSYTVKLGDKTSATAVIAMQKSAKNILFTYANTEYILANNKGLDSSTLIAERTKVFAWWIPVLIAIDVIFLAAAAYTTLKLWLPSKKKEKDVFVVND